MGELNRRAKLFLITAALMALFLGALDALVVGAAMPTIVADLGGLPLYSWVFSSYMLARAVSLPVFGKLCDLFSTRRLYLISIVIFLGSSLMAGMAGNMEQLILFRTLQGVGAGGAFALAYIVLSSLYPSETRGKMMGLISMVWGISSMVGPPVGGFIVAWASWRWIFYINLPMGFLALLGIGLYLRDTSEKKKDTSIDFLGALALAVSVTALLSAFLMGGRSYPWVSVEIGGLFAAFIVSTALFCYAESRARNPILALGFFWNPRFSLANGAAFFSSFAIFSLSAFSPLFIQGVLGKSPAELGVAMVPLTLGWSGGAMICGQIVTAAREKNLSMFGSLLLAIGAGLCLTLSFPGMPALLFSGFLAVAGMGMGFVTVPTLLIVQKSLDASNLGVATSSQQFARTLGGTIGIGISGGLVASSMANSLSSLADSSQALSASVARRLGENMEALFQPQVQAQLTSSVKALLRAAIGGSVEIVFWSALVTSAISLLLCFFLPDTARSSERDGSRQSASSE